MSGVISVFVTSPTSTVPVALQRGRGLARRRTLGLLTARHARAPEAHERPDPLAHRRGGRHKAGHPAQLEVRVGVDEAGQQRHIAEIFRRTWRRSCPKPRDAAVAGFHPASVDGWPADRQHPSRAVDHRASRAFRPAALRAS